MIQQDSPKASGLWSRIQSILKNIRVNSQKALDRTLPAEKRAEMLSKFQEFAIRNPKLAAFLVIQLMFTGFPLLLFLAFSTTIFIFSLLTALLIGLIVALFFTLLMVGVALLVVLPTIFVMTFTASFFFLWGLGGYYVLKWVSERGASASTGKAVETRINKVGTGREGWLSGGGHQKVTGTHGDVDEKSSTHGREKESSKGSADGEVNGTSPQLEDRTDERTNGFQKGATPKANGIENVLPLTEVTTTGTD